MRNVGVLSNVSDLISRDYARADLYDLWTTGLDPLPEDLVPQIVISSSK